MLTRCKLLEHQEACAMLAMQQPAMLPAHQSSLVRPEVVALPVRRSLGLRQNDGDQKATTDDDTAIGKTASNGRAANILQPCMARIDLHSETVQLTAGYKSVAAKSLSWTPPKEDLLETPSTSASVSPASTPPKGAPKATSFCWDAPFVTPRPRSGGAARHLKDLLGEGPLQMSVSPCSLCETIFFESMPRENVSDLSIEQLRNDSLQQRFREAVRRNGGWHRVRAAWHFPGSEEAMESILSYGIACDEAHCACGRYGRGGYVALSAAKAHAYADSFGEGGARHLFLVLALPDDDLVSGERGTRPERTAADLPSHPTELCFVDPSRLYCAFLLKYNWLPTGRRQKVYAAAPRVSHVVTPPCHVVQRRSS